MNDIICFGELLIRLSPALSGEWIRTSSMDCYIGGAELNVATALAAWKQPVRYVSALPDHYLSREIVAALTANGIDCRAIRFGGPRIGTYFLPQGADLKDRAVIMTEADLPSAGLDPEKWTGKKSSMVQAGCISVLYRQHWESNRPEFVWKPY